MIFGLVAAVMREASGAVEEVGQRLGVPAWITGGLSGGFAMMGRGAEGLSNADIGGSILAGVSGIRDGLGVGNFFSSGSAPDVQESVKLGRSAGLHMGLTSQEPVGQFEANFNSIQVPQTEFNLGAAQVGRA